MHRKRTNLRDSSNEIKTLSKILLIALIFDSFNFIDGGI